MKTKSKKIRIGVYGSSGRMGLEISKILKDHPNLEPYFGLAIDGVNPIFKNHGTQFTDLGIEEVDVWIDFAAPEAFNKILNYCVKAKKPLVSGTTGLSSKQFSALKTASEKIPILWSSNMSLGVAVLKETLKSLALLEGFDFQIEEIHHKRKKDNPSGTAMTLQAELLKVVAPQKVPHPIGIRGGGVFGVHKVWAFSEEETLMFEHQALNRTVFARGAVLAAQWIFKQKNGLYNINNVIMGRRNNK